MLATLTKPAVFEPTELTQLADEIAAEIVERREWVDACDYPEGMGMNVAPAKFGRMPFSATVWDRSDEIVATQDGTLCECTAFVLAQRIERGAR